MSSAHRRVLFILSSLRFGGMEKHTVALLNGLNQRFDLSLATLREENALLPQLDVDGLAHRIGLQARGKLDLGAARRLRSWLAAHPQDLIICVNEYPLLYASIALRGCTLRPRVVDIFHTTVYRTFKERVQMMIYRPLFRRLDALIYVSEKQREYWNARGLGPAHNLTIHNGIDTGHFDPSLVEDAAAETRRLAGFGADDYVIAVCAALRPEKAHGDLVEAIANLRRDGVPARGLFIGDGSERASIERRIAELGLGDSIRITGLQSDVRPWIAGADVFVLPSHAIETFSVAALEAMALGKPLVMTRIGGAEEQVEEGANGLLFDPGNIAQLQSCLARLAEPELRCRFGTRSAVLVRERFTEGQMLARYSGVFERLCAAGEAT